MKHFIHILLCIEPYSCLMHQYLLDTCNSSHRVLCTTYIRGSFGHSKKALMRNIYNRQIHHHPSLSCLLSHSNSFGTFSSNISFLTKQHYMHPSNKLFVLCLRRFEGEQASSVRFMEWWAFSVLNGSLLSSNINEK